MQETPPVLSGPSDSAGQKIRVPFVDLGAQYHSIKKDIDQAIASVIADTAFIRGKYVQAFEESFAAAYGVRHVIGCANGTDSLYIIMKMLGIGPGDEVITAANSWISSSETITQTGARPVFIDIHPEYYSLDESLLAGLITPKTRALIAVHLQGQACDNEKISAICRERGIFLIEDCAQAHFSAFGNKKVGLSGIASSFSFYPGKNLGDYGDAGCIITNDDALAEKCRMYANHGSLKKHEHQMEGINSRLDGLQAAILSAKLPHLQAWTKKRILLASWYDQYLAGIGEIIPPRVRPGTVHTFHLYVIRARNRQALQKFLAGQGIETQIHYPRPLPFLPAYQYLGYQEKDFPVCTSIRDEILSLPLYPEMTEEMVAYVARHIRGFYH